MNDIPAPTDARKRVPRVSAEYARIIAPPSDEAQSFGEVAWRVVARVAVAMESVEG